MDFIGNQGFRQLPLVSELCPGRLIQQDEDKDKQSLINFPVERQIERAVMSLYDCLSLTPPRLPRAIDLPLHLYGQRARAGAASLIR